MEILFPVFREQAKSEDQYVEMLALHMGMDHAWQVPASEITNPIERTLVMLVADRIS